MQISAELEKYIDELDKNQGKREAINNHIDLARKEQENFVSIFPRREIRNINVLDYVPGKTIDGDEPDRKTFAYLTEYGSRNFGGIGGGSAKKFAIYMKKDTEELVFPPNFTSSDEAYDYTINLIADCLDLAEEYIKTDNWKKFSDTITELVESKSGTPSIPIISKIIAIYYPDEFIRLWSHQWLNKTLDLFEVKRDDLPEGGKEGKFYEKMQRVVEAKNSHPIMKEWSNEYFSYGIGDYLSPKNKEKDNVSPLLKFVRDEMLMRANYQPIVIKMLLEKKDEAFTVAIDDIRKKFDELNFGRYSYTNTSSGEPMGNSAISTVKKALEKFVTFPDSTSEGKAALHLDQLDSKDIPEVLKICGQKLVKYHIENLMEDERKYWFVQAGSKGGNLEKFREGGYAAVDYKDVCDFDLSGLERDEIDIKTGGEKVQELLNISQIKQGDVVAVVKGNKTVEEFAIATSDYYFVNSDTERDKHRVNIEYLNFGTLEFGKNWNAATMPDASGKIKKFLVGEDLIKYVQISDTLKEDSRTIEILKRKKNIILYGPPGTGKTFTAKIIADKITNNYKIKLPDDSKKQSWYEYLKKEILRNDPGCDIDTTEGESYFLITSSDGNKKKIYISYGNKDNDNIRVEVGIKEKGTNWLKSAEKDQAFVLIVNLSKNCFVVMTYQELKKYGKFRGGENWDETGEDRMWFTLNELDNNNAILNSKTVGEHSHDELNILEGLNNFRLVFSRKNNSKQNIVTFHQSYGYEEFVEGIRPESTNKGIIYSVKPGIFKKICEKAKNSREKTVLIIDEINRGNISKIFGELITIIENDKRGTEVTLAYSGEQFSVPENVYIIGTMNTADQSLTHIDAALKRRFSSIEIMPDYSILKKGMKGLPELLDKINEKVREKRSRDNQIGHSYFMQDGKAITEMKELQFVFATDIIPLLRDYFYDSDDDLKEVLGEQFIDWDEGSDRTVKEDWQNNIETFRIAIKQAYDVII